MTVALGRAPDELHQLRERVRTLEAVLKQNDHRLALRYQLTPQLSNVLGLLLSVELVTPHMLEQRLGITSDCKVTVCRLRKCLELYDIKIHGKRGAGWWLDEATKSRINRYITAGVTAGAVGVALLSYRHQE